MLAIKILVACLVATFSTSVSAQVSGDTSRGLAFALRMCASCHGVQPTDLSSPRPNTVTFREVANAPGMTGIAINVFLQTPHREMPNLIINSQDRADVISYIVSLDVTPKTK